MTEENNTKQVDENPSIGARLRAAREKMGDMSIQTVNESTHIRKEFLTLMEDDRIDQIPLAPVYRIGFLRIYAKFLRLDANALVEEYKKQTKLIGGNTRKPIPGVPFNVEISDGTENAVSLEPAESKGSFSFVRMIVWAAVIFAIAAVGYFGFQKISGLAENSVPVEVNDPANIEYEIQVSSTASQRVVIYENYKGWDREKSAPIAGKIILDETVIAGGKRSLKAHGQLYVQQNVRGATSVIVPAKEVIEAAIANNLEFVPVGVNTKTHSLNTGNSFIVDPLK